MRRSQDRYAKGHRVFVGCSRQKVQSLADKALLEEDRAPDLLCGCEPALAKVSDVSRCNTDLCRLAECLLPLDFGEAANFSRLNSLLCLDSSSAWEARLTGEKKTQATSIHQTPQFQYSCCRASDTGFDNIAPPGIAGQRFRPSGQSMVEEDLVCPAMYRYRCANVYVPPPRLNLTRPGRRLFWRVDSIMTQNGSDSLLVPGEIWSFRTAPTPTPPQSEKPRAFDFPLGKPQGHCPAPQIGAPSTWTGPVCTTRYETAANVSLAGATSGLDFI